MLPPLKAAAAGETSGRRPSLGPSTSPSPNLPALVQPVQLVKEPSTCAHDAATAEPAPASGAAAPSGLTRAQQRQQEAWGSLAGGRVLRRRVRGKEHTGCSHCFQALLSTAVLGAMPAGVGLEDMLRQAPHRTQRRPRQPQPLDLDVGEVADRGEHTPLVVRIGLVVQLPVAQLALPHTSKDDSSTWLSTQHNLPDLVGAENSTLSFNSSPSMSSSPTAPALQASPKPPLQQSLQGSPASPASASKAGAGVRQGRRRTLPPPMLVESFERLAALHRCGLRNWSTQAVFARALLEPWLSKYAGCLHGFY